MAQLSTWPTFLPVVLLTSRMIAFSWPGVGNPARSDTATSLVGGVAVCKTLDLGHGHTTPTTARGGGEKCYWNFCGAVMTPGQGKNEKRSAGSLFWLAASSRPLKREVQDFPTNGRGGGRGQAAFACPVRVYPAFLRFPARYWLLFDSKKPV